MNNYIELNITFVLYLLLNNFYTNINAVDIVVRYGDDTTLGFIERQSMFCHIQHVLQRDLAIHHSFESLVVCINAKRAKLLLQVTTVAMMVPVMLY